MKDVRLLCVVLFVGCLVGAVAAQPIQKILHSQAVSLSHPTGKGTGVLTSTKVGSVCLFMEAKNGVSTNIVVSNTMNTISMFDGEKKMRLGLSVDAKGESNFFMSSKGSSTNVLVNKSGSLISMTDGKGRKRWHLALAKKVECFYTCWTLRVKEFGGPRSPKKAS